MANLRVAVVRMTVPFELVGGKAQEEARVLLVTLFRLSFGSLCNVSSCPLVMLLAWL